MQEMAHAWEEYSCLEKSVEQLRTALQAHMNHSTTPQVRPQVVLQPKHLIYNVLAETDFDHRCEADIGYY